MVSDLLFLNEFRLLMIISVKKDVEWDLCFRVVVNFKESYENFRFQ